MNQHLGETANSIIESVEVVDEIMGNTDLEEIENDPINPHPPSYYTEFTTPDAMQPPNLALLSDKNYCLLFQKEFLVEVSLV